MSTQEIDKAIEKLDITTLKESLITLKVPCDSEKDILRQRYQESVLTVGLKNFIHKLKPIDIQNVCKAMKIPDSEKEVMEALEDVAIKNGINGLVEAVDGDLLKNFCETLGLDCSDATDMKKQIADEVMLTGMESLLNRLSKILLQKHASEMGIKSSGEKKELVERLMVHIFELEPLEEIEKTKIKPKKEKKKKKELESKPTKKEKKPKEKKEPQEKKEPVKREKFVAPPLDTICKGKYDSYTALYDNFNLPDLVNYCKQEDLKTTGKKKDVIKRMLHYLHTGEKEEQKKEVKKT